MSISLPGLFPVLLLAQGSSFCGLQGSTSLPISYQQVSAQTNWNQKQEETHGRWPGMREDKISRGESEQEKETLNGHPEEDPQGRPPEPRGQQS